MFFVVVVVVALQQKHMVFRISHSERAFLSAVYFETHCTIHTWREEDTQAVREKAAACVPTEELCCQMEVHMMCTMNGKHNSALWLRQAVATKYKKILYSHQSMKKKGLQSSDK